ncbi:hypothetical protein BGZ60DRAFT_378592 [Tricladium varicosporioides]|nr:hypothetical protein BGZ60DRAFT_378592 [Hymenoscyphus varicosporioides]
MASSSIEPHKSALILAKEKPVLPTQEEVTKILKAATLHNDPREKNLDRSTTLLKAYLLKNEPEFVRVTEFRDRGWVQNKEKGDAHFKMQREKADHADEEGEKRFYKMMQEIADEMQTRTLAFTPRRGSSPRPTRNTEFKSLDICMAPGGYTAAVLKYHPNAKAYGITLPVDQGGHPLHIEKGLLAGLHKFAAVQVFKPKSKHATRSSFYMIAKDVRPDGAKTAIQEWKDSWWKATFGGEDGTGERQVEPPESFITAVLKEYGERLMEMGRAIWRIQADALSKTDYAGDGSASTPFSRRNQKGKDSKNLPWSPKPLSVGQPSFVKLLKENVAPSSQLAKRNLISDITEVVADGDLL